MAKFKTRTASTADRGGFGLEFEGVCHLVITAIDPNPVKKTGEAKDGLEVTVGVLASTESRNVGRSSEEMFYNPRDSSGDQGDFARRIQTRFFHCIGLIADSQLDQEVEIDLDLAIGRQFIAKFAPGKPDKTGKTWIRINGTDMWHVDDPYCESIPKDKSAIDSIPAALRRKAEQKSATAVSKTNPKKVTSQPPKTTEFSEPVTASAQDEVEVL